MHIGPLVSHDLQRSQRKIRVRVGPGLHTSPCATVTGLPKCSVSVSIVVMVVVVVVVFLFAILLMLASVANIAVVRCLNLCL